MPVPIAVPKIHGLSLKIIPLKMEKKKDMRSCFKRMVSILVKLKRNVDICIGHQVVSVFETSEMS